MSIKYYQLAKDEELPEEFCAVRDVNGEPSEYTWYERMSEYIDVYIDTTTKVPEDATEFDYELFERFMSGGPWVAHSEYMKLKDENAKLRKDNDCLIQAIEDLHDVSLEDRLVQLENENAKLREQIERLQPKDCEGNVLGIADTVSMLRSEYDGDHEWDDVVVELALTKWGGDRWIVRGSKGEAWACECTKTGYDEDAYEGSDDAEPIANPTLIEAENAALRTLVSQMYRDMQGVLDMSTDTVWVDDIGTLRDMMDCHMQAMAELDMPPADFDGIDKT